MVGYLSLSLLVSSAPFLAWCCSDYLMHGYRLNGFTDEQIDSIGVHSCIKECLLRQPRCQSINYDTQMFLCEMNSREADIEVEGVPNTDSIFANVNGSSRESLDECQNSFCSSLQKCVTTRKSHVCISTACKPGTYGKDGQCEPCPIGQYNLGGQWCLFCPAGTYQDGTGSSQCKSCPPGTRQPFEGQTTAESCLPCGSGKYQPHARSDVCWDCPPGFYQPDSGQPYCLVCPEGQYQDKFGQTQCLDCSGFIKCTDYNRTSCHEKDRPDPECIILDKGDRMMLRNPVPTKNRPNAEAYRRVPYLRKRDKEDGHYPASSEGQQTPSDCKRLCREWADCRAFSLARGSGPRDCWIFDHNSHYRNDYYNHYEFPKECHP